MAQKIDVSRLKRLLNYRVDARNGHQVLLHYYDKSIGDQVNSLKNRLSKKGFSAVNTYQGRMERYVFSGAPLTSKEMFDYTAYAASLVLDFFRLGVEIFAYSELARLINKFIDKLTTDKDVLLIHEIERERNFPLQICFAVSRQASSDVRLQAINDILLAIKAVNENITRYADQEIMVIKYNQSNKIWNLESPVFYLRNHGTVGTFAERVGKRFGHALEKDMPNKPYSNYWEYTNVEIPKKAMDNALLFRISYYQRLCSVEDIKRTVFLTGAAQVSVYMYDNFFNAPSGRVVIPTDDCHFAGSHSVCVIGYSDENKEFKFINSWGDKWGDHGYGYLSYDYVSRFLVESWGSSPLFSLKKRIKNILNPIRWLFFIKELLDYFFKRSNTTREKIIERGIFEDKRRVKMRYEIKVATPLCVGKGYFYIINIFESGNDGRYGAWCHFSLNGTSNCIEVDELFVAEEFRNYGWGKSLISLVEKYAKRNGIQKIYGWSFVYDSYNDLVANYHKNFFSKLGYKCIDDDGAHVGSLFRFEKFI